MAQPLVDLSLFTPRLLAIGRGQHIAMAATIRTLAEMTAAKYKELEAPFRRSGDLIGSVRVEPINQYAARVIADAYHAHIIEEGHGPIDGNPTLHWQTRGGEWVVARRVSAWPGRHSMAKAKEAVTDKAEMVMVSTLLRFGGATGTGPGV